MVPPLGDGYLNTALADSRTGGVTGEAHGVVPDKSIAMVKHHGNRQANHQSRDIYSFCPAIANCVQRKQKRVLVHTQFFTKTRHPLIRAGHTWRPRSSGCQNCLTVGYDHGAISDGDARNGMRCV